MCIRDSTHTHRQTHTQTHRHFSENDFFSCFECSTIRICNNLERDFFCHHRTSISLRNMEVISVWRTIHDFHTLRFIFKIIYETKCFHRNYVFLLIASALTTGLWSLTYTTSRFRTRFSLIMAVDGTAETTGFAENIGLRPNSPGKEF